MKAEEKVHKAEEKSQKAAVSTRKVKSGMKRKAKETASNSHNTRGEMQPPKQKAA